MARLVRCQVCARHVADLAICSYCSISGHPGCIGAAIVCGFDFCAECARGARAQYERAVNAKTEAQWRERLAEKLAAWKSTGIITTGALSSVGITVGSASAALVTGTAAFLRGAVQGATATTEHAVTAAIQDEERNRLHDPDTVFGNGSAPSAGNGSAPSGL